MSDPLVNVGHEILPACFCNQSACDPDSTEEESHDQQQNDEKDTETNS